MKFLMKWSFWICITFILQANAWGADSFKVGILDLQKVFSASNEGKRVYAALKEKQEALQKKLTAKEDELKEFQKELEKQSLMLSLEAKEDKQKDFERKRRELQYLFQDINEDMKKSEMTAQQQMMNDLKVVIDKIAKESGYEIIFEATRSNVVFWSGKADITEEVVSEYNKMKP
ncbi:MAG: OmpH family outer membrane protein [Deltaproteobacteria bacterium]|nr:OmpH family outer membrane protein [Deltaproteobacteria bacterium]